MPGPTTGPFGRPENSRGRRAAFHGSRRPAPLLPTGKQSRSPGPKDGCACVSDFAPRRAAPRSVTRIVAASGCVKKAVRRLPSSRNAFSTLVALAVPKWGHVAYAFSMRYVLGLDGGGTKTECVLMEESRRVVASSRGGPSNPMRVGFGGALASGCEAARVAIATAKVSGDEVVALCAGLARTAYPESDRKMRLLLEGEFPGKLIRICTDMDLTLEAVGAGAAIVLIAGTGSPAVGRDSRGNTARVGGQ